MKHFTDYSLIKQQIISLISDETDLIANLANIAACLNEGITDINWVGFYLYKEEQLILGPFQGKPACIRIPLEKGVCGTSFRTRTIQRISDVHQFPGHIACDSASNSEIVIPLIKDNHCYGVLDIDSQLFARFGDNDEQALNQIVTEIMKYCF